MASRPKRIYLQRPQALIVAIEAQKIEGHERGLCAAALGHERAEVTAPVVPEHDRLAVVFGTAFR
jgi:hypothetical protein